MDLTTGELGPDSVEEFVAQMGNVVKVFKALDEETEMFIEGVCKMVENEEMISGGDRRMESYDEALGRVRELVRKSLEKKNEYLNNLPVAEYFKEDAPDQSLESSNLLIQPSQYTQKQLAGVSQKEVQPARLSTDSETSELSQLKISKVKDTIVRNSNKDTVVVEIDSSSSSHSVCSQSDIRQLPNRIPQIEQTSKQEDTIKTEEVNSPKVKKLFQVSFSIHESSSEGCHRSNKIESSSEYDSEDYHQDAQHEHNNQNPEENKSSLADPSSSVYSASESEYKSPEVAKDFIKDFYKIVPCLDDSKSTLQCKLCHTEPVCADQTVFETQDEDAMKGHIAIHSKDTAVKFRGSKALPLEYANCAMFKTQEGLCPMCFKFFKSPYSLSMHIRQHWSAEFSDRPFKCLIAHCTYATYRFDQLKRHYMHHLIQLPAYMQNQYPEQIPILFNIAQITRDYIAKLDHFKKTGKSPENLNFKTVMGVSFDSYASAKIQSLDLRYLNKRNI
ncbi:unnamed protein product [Moneuplotes crassus]|uniref:C2H2-type domain-containing protein n=1 Tax=Euplotes crassus TaxID=5936 RepID=A0AAD1XAP5_EUPCR|nr:unnamed protein product [Moneuplotes crassus]